MLDNRALLVESACRVKSVLCGILNRKPRITFLMSCCPHTLIEVHYYLDDPSSLQSSAAS